MLMFWPIMVAGALVSAGLVLVLAVLELERMLRQYERGGGAPEWVVHFRKQRSS